MKRSEINQAIDFAADVLKRHQFHLPPFARWSPEKWREVGSRGARIAACGLGWDVSDYGAGDFGSFGTVFFTIRNGRPGEAGLGTPYAEKIMILKPGQRLPLHFHWSKTEDIINRGGGILVMELYNAHEDDSLDTSSDVKFTCDGIERTVAAGGTFELMPGESITLTPRMYHRFWAGKNGGVLICGEVSTTNDDITDNCFAETVSRYTTIEEDEPARYMLVNELVIS
ncbi:MAG: D-lyxose/D-mannose family sugar isomerase [Armatimonadetes bacterium]|nr:D-lyxose/D-mannose family sugar isomerase [Armatimonadota bacterium]